ncbi:putative glucarate transporter [Armadillidium nasatum]|uniref:Putative glucarate transporter n=1 Tax=Armadillidium nasatum TaxID=96803 RepID=A0A5N5TEV8_9CRUS|nr:putative glucarate transporter [Armadillidium nasatum]
MTKQKKDVVIIQSPTWEEQGGRIAEIVGPRKVYGCTVLVSSVISLFIPMAAHSSPIAVIVLRILMGLAQGPSFPSAHAILANWAPPQERSFLSSILYAGNSDYKINTVIFIFNLCINLKKLKFKVFTMFNIYLIMANVKKDWRILIYILNLPHRKK